MFSSYPSYGKFRRGNYLRGEINVKVFKLAFILVLAFALFAGTASGSGSMGDGSADLTPVQLIADQGTVTANGKVKYHLIYHNVENKAVTNTHVKVRISEDWEVFDRGTAEWDETLRFLHWNFKEVRAGGAEVVHFQLKMKAGAKAGSVHELEAEAALGADIIWKTPKVKVTVGTQTHQPFMQGYPDGTFRPDSKLTRAETAAMIARIKGLQTLSGEAYTDVAPSHWAYSYIQQVTAQGYMVGYEGHFRPEDPITKAELVTLMLRLHGVSFVPLKTAFADMKGHWSEAALGTAYALGYIDPLKEGVVSNFSPDQAIERKRAAQWVAIGLLRGPLHDGDAEVVQHFPDVAKNHPFFHWIEEASSVAHESENHGEGVEQLIRYLPNATNPF
jgi:hypothetical protein